MRSVSRICTVAVALMLAPTMHAAAQTQPAAETPAAAPGAAATDAAKAAPKKTGPYVAKVPAKKPAPKPADGTTAAAGEGAAVAKKSVPKRTATAGAGAPAATGALAGPAAKKPAPKSAAAAPAAAPGAAVNPAAITPAKEMADAPKGSKGRCTRLGFSVNDYGKEGPARDAQKLLDNYIASWAAKNNIKGYKVGKKTVTCELFLDFGVFDEHTCKATAPVCW